MPCRNRHTIALCPTHSRVCRQEPGTPGPPETPGPDTAATAVTDTTADRFLRCAQCLAPVTRERDRMTVNGAHRHVFANPYGVVYEIGCFARAPGCALLVGPPTPDFSWFPGTAWQVAVCAACGQHLGWRYTGHSRGPFYGLILPRLLQASDTAVRDGS